MNNNPYGVQYGQRQVPYYNPYGVKYRQNPELLPKLGGKTVYDGLRDKAGELVDEYALPALAWAGGQALEKAALLGLTGKSLGQWAMYGGGRLLNTPAALATLSTLQATRAGEPIINGITRFARSPTGQKLKNYAEQAIDWIF